MQLALETFDLLKRALDLDDDGARDVASAWQTGALNRFRRDDSARWTSQAARELEAPAPTIDAAVGMRALSELEEAERFYNHAVSSARGAFWR